MSEESTAEPEHNGEGGTSADHPAHATHEMRVAPSTVDERNTLRAAILPVACWRLNDLRFEFDSSFVKPQAAKEMHKLHELREKFPHAPASVFGHADPVGNDEYNKALSGRRATAIYALLVRDAAMWESLFKNSADHWGVKSIQHMLHAVGNNPGPIDGQTGPATTDAVKAFQTANGLSVDGAPGPLTRG